MIYIVALVLPPLGLLLNGQLFSALLNLALIIPCLLFGLVFHPLLLVPSLHALVAVHDFVECVGNFSFNPQPFSRKANVGLAFFECNKGLKKCRHLPAGFDRRLFNKLQSRICGHQKPLIGEI